MAFTEFYAQTTGSNLNSGSTTSDAAVYTATNGGWDSTTGIFTPATGNPSLTVAVNDWASLYNDGATLTVYVGLVTAVSSTTITVSLTAKSGTAPTTSATARTCKVGGAWQGPNGGVKHPFAFATAAMVNAAGDPVRINFKTGTYSITSSISNTLAGLITYQGYTTTVGDGGKATIDGGSSNIVLFTTSGKYNTIVDFIFANNATGTTSHAFTCTNYTTIKRCIAHDVRGHGFVGATNSVFIECEAYNCNTSNTSMQAGFFLTDCFAYRCISHDNAGSNTIGFLNGASANNGFWLYNCIADTNGLYGFHDRNRDGSVLMHCDAYNNVSDGFRITEVSTGAPVFIYSCNFVKNGGYGINRTDALSTIFASNNGFGSGTMANTSGDTFAAGMATSVIENSVTYAANITPWVDPDNGDFRINLLAAKGTGRGSFTQTAASYAGTSSYIDIGSAQHTDYIPIAKTGTLNNYEFGMVLSSDHISNATGKAVTATRSIDGGAFAACANGVTEVANGVYKINLATTDTNGDVITFRFAAATCDDRFITLLTQVLTRNTALTAFEFLLLLSSDHASSATGKAVTATRSIDGSSFAACANAVTEVSSGIYKINLAATDLNGGVITLRFTASACDDRFVTLIMT